MAHGGGGINDPVAPQPYGCAGPVSYLTGAGYCGDSAPAPDRTSFYSDPIRVARGQAAMATGGSPWYATDAEPRLASKIIYNSIFTGFSDFVVMYKRSSIINVS